MFSGFVNKTKVEQETTSITAVDSLTIYAGNTAKLTLTGNGEVEVTSMKSLDSNIADVKAGYVIAYNTGSTKVITEAIAEGKKYTFTTEIIVKSGEVTIAPETATIHVGETLRLKTMVSCGVFKSILCQSDNLSVATVRQEGICSYVKGLSEGETHIRITVNVGNQLQEKVIPVKVEAAKEHKLPINKPISGQDYIETDDWQGSRVFFGEFEQDNNIRNGREPILWRVLEITKDTVLLLSEYGLINKFYHDTYDNVTWETSSLRAWLNSDFLDIAFTRTEMNAIHDTLLKNTDHKTYGSSGGNKTVDKVFLISKKDANNPDFGFMKGVKKKSLTRALQTTEYAMQEGYANKDNGNTCWWLRSPGLTNQYASYVFTNGSITDVYFVGRRNDAVRPAIRVKLSDIVFGENMSDGKYSCPRIIAKSRL